MTQRAKSAAGWVLEFTVYSFIGWVYETVLTSIVWGKFAERGVLHLPLLPIYGFCSLLMILMLGRIKNIPKTKAADSNNIRGSLPYIYIG